MNTKAITEGGVLCGIAVVMALLSYYVPFLLIFYIFVPLPIVVLSKRRGFITSFIASVAASAILFFFIDWPNAVVYAMYLVLVGCSLGFTYHKNYRGVIRMGVAYAAVLITLMGSLFLYQKLSGVVFMDSLMTEIQTAFSQVSHLYESTGLLSGEQLSTLSGGGEAFLATFKMVIPTAFLVAPIFVAWLNILLCDRVLIRMEEEIIPLNPLSAWRLPRSLKVFMMLLVIVVSIFDFMESKPIPEIYLFTITEIINLIFVIMGVSFCFWFFNRKRQKESVGIKVLIVILTLLISPVTYVLSLIGLADSFLRIRDIIGLKDQKK